MQSLFMQKMQFMNKLKISSLVDCFLGFLKSFLSGFPPYDAFLVVVSIEKRCIYI